MCASAVLREGSGSLRTSPERSERVVRRYGGAYSPSEIADVDSKPEIDQKCHPKCVAVWETYKQSETRIEEKVGRAWWNLCAAKHACDEAPTSWST